MQFILEEIQIYSVSGKSIAQKKKCKNMREQTEVNADGTELKQSLLSSSTGYFVKVDLVHSSCYWQRYAGISSEKF